MTRRLLVLAVAGLIGCGGESSDAVEGGAPGAGVTGEWNRSPQTAWRLEEELRLGTASSDRPAEQFGDIAAIAVDSRGDIYVLDAMARRIQVFHGDGTFSHTLGGAGEGPGELGYASALAVGPGDTLTVLDDGNMRYTVFAADGTVVGTHRRAIVGRAGHLRPARLPDGSYLDWGIAFPDGRMGERVVHHPIAYATGFERADTFPPVTFRRTMVSDGSLPLLRFNGFVVGAVDGSGRLWVADSRTYRIVRRGLAGDTTRVLALPAAPAPVGEAERAFVRERFAHRPEVVEAQLEALPATKPVLHAIVPDGAGHVWVFPELADAPAGTVADVFRATGTYLGRIALPTPLACSNRDPPVVHITGEHLYGVVTDALDVPYVVRFRIIKPGQGP